MQTIDYFMPGTGGSRLNYFRCERVLFSIPNSILTSISTRVDIEETDWIKIVRETETRTGPLPVGLREDLLE